MKVKKFVAKNYTEALSQVKREFGEDALIITTRSVRPNPEARSGAHSSQVEITAAVDFSAVAQWKAENIKKESTPETAVLEYGEDDLKPLMRALLSQTDRAQAMGIKSHQMGLCSRLLKSGVSEKLIPRLMEKSEAEEPGKGQDVKSGARRLLALMKETLDCRGDIQLDREGPKKVALVGPTGVGKTTTIAKIAADFVYRQKKKVALLSLDTFRVGAVDQLRIYGDIMRIPVEMAADKTEYRRFMHKHSDRDIILIDTTGRSHRDKAYVGQLQNIFTGTGGVETHLVLNAGAQEQINEASFEQFAPIGLDRVLFTKLDEGLSYGQLFNFSVRSRLPFSYLTSGQRVPEDIEAASREKVIRLIFN